MERSGFAVRSRAWIERNGRSLLGKGRLELLDQIVELGSISAASRAIGVSYRLAWKWIDEMNEVAGRPLIETTTGGKGGGGAALTAFGQDMLRAIRTLTTRLAEFEEQMTTELEVFFSRPPARTPRKRRPSR
jgi:molybdate transport system regulatory protein